ncbi:hypothetical protein BJ742DRAFT_813212 [Cladochytrium replicatum]|nr:hypothetical protein BJ742DRAFT_813212 [Cladochytrium replicatum]
MDGPAKAVGAPKRSRLVLLLLLPVFVILSFLVWSIGSLNKTSSEPIQTSSNSTNPDIITRHNEGPPLSLIVVIQIFSLCIIVLFGVSGGLFAERFDQPPMLGMLLSGVAVRNLLGGITVPVPHSWSSKIWAVALSSVLARAGLAIRKDTVTSRGWQVLLFGSLPVIFEAAFLGNLTAYTFSMPSEWAATLAFGVASISPGVVVPLLLNLLEDNSWRGSRLPNVLLAASGLDVLVATSGFGVALAAIFGHKHESGSLAETSRHRNPQSSGNADQATHVVVDQHSFWARGLEEVGGGLLVGFLLGCLALLIHKYSVSHQTRSDEIITRSNHTNDEVHENTDLPASISAPAFLFLFSLTAVTTAAIKSSGFPGAATSSVIVAYCIITNSWDETSVATANRVLKVVWKWAEPFLFTLIGATIAFNEFPVWLLCKAMVVVLSSVVVRAFVTFAVAHMAGLPWKECVFVSGTWCGKASVQAALSFATIEYVHRYHLEGTIEDGYSKIVFACMLSAVIIGGPIAATWVGRFAGWTRWVEEPNVLPSVVKHLEED